MSFDKDSKSHPFVDEVDDFEFLNHPRQGQTGYILKDSNNEENAYEARQKLLLEERRRIEERTLQSTNCSLGLLYESEQVGVQTAEELVHQREQLQNVEQNLDKMNSTMKISQKHINSMKSVFGSIKNYFSGKSSTDSAVKPTATVPASVSALPETIGNLRITEKEYTESSHPALRIRGLDMYDADESKISRPMSNSNSNEKVFKPTASKRFTRDIDEKIDKNLETMSLGLGRLKNLASGLNEEIEQQNEMLDRIHDKADRAEESLETQNRQIKHILKK